VRERSSEKYKQAVLRKLAHSSLSLRQFAAEEGIAISTLHKWRDRYEIETLDKPVSVSSDRWSSEEKFAVVLECAALSEIELNEYCRASGLYPEQVTLWKHGCIQGNMKSDDQQKKANVRAKADKKRIKELERELARKEKALAEAAAALWEENEDD